MAQSYGWASPDIITSGNCITDGAGCWESLVCKLYMPGPHYESVTSQQDYNDDYEQASS